MGCDRALSNQIIEPGALNADMSYSDITCFGADNGSISLTVSGGTIPYSYSWSNSTITASVSGLTPGTYYYTVTDANECSQNGSQEISYNFV